MAELVNTININVVAFNNLKRYLDGNPEYVLFTSSSGETLKVDLKKQKNEEDSAENIVVRWMNDIKKKTTNYTDYSSATRELGEIKSYCDAVIVAVTSK